MERHSIQGTGRTVVLRDAPATQPWACLLPPRSRPGVLGTWGPAPEDRVLSHHPRSPPPENCVPGSGP